jgi:tetratricopeptide (TPR) repeat protein
MIFYFAQLLIEAMPLPIDLVNEHRLYLAMLSIIMPVVGLVILKPKKIRMLLVSWILIAAFFGFFTWQRNRAWGSEIGLWKDVVSKSPAVARWWNYYCASLIDQGEAAKARPACEVAVRLDPGLADAHQNMGVILFQQGDYSEAAKELEEATRINPKYTLAWFNLGLVTIAQGDLAGAKKYFKKVEELGSRDAAVYFNLGLIYEKTGDDADALRLFKTALALRPEWIEPRLELAHAFTNNGMCKEAVDIIKSSPANDPRFQQVIDQCRAANGL